MLRRPVRVCFVCSGNICRSPTAEVVLRAIAEESGRGDLVVVDSAGTGSWHAGEEMDRRARATMVDAGYDVAGHVAKQFRARDFAERDVVVALDSGHHDELSALDHTAAERRLVRLRDFDPALGAGEPADVADPYYGEDDGFTEVLAQVRRSCEVLLDAIEDAVRSGADGVVAPARRAPGDQQADRPPL